MTASITSSTCNEIEILLYFSDSRMQHILRNENLIKMTELYL